MIIKLLKNLDRKDFLKCGKILGLNFKNIYKRSLLQKAIIYKLLSISKIKIKEFDLNEIENQLLRYWIKTLKVKVPKDLSNDDLFNSIILKVKKYKDFEKLKKRQKINKFLKTTSVLTLPFNPGALIVLNKVTKDGNKRKVLELFNFFYKLNSIYSSRKYLPAEQNSEKLDLRNKKIGLVLSGGGARGSYEVGVLQELLKLGLEFDVVAGTSVGALNGAIVAQGDFENALNIWENLVFENVFFIDKRKIIGLVFDILEIFLLGKASAAIKLLLAGKKGWELLNLGFLNPEPMRKILNANLDYDKIIKSKTKFIICTTNLHYKNIKEFHVAQELDKQQLIKILWASTSIPFLFPSGNINGDIKMDGGIPIIGENVPISAVISEDLDVLITIFTKKEPIPIIQKKKDKIIINIYPDERYYLNKALKFDKDFIQGLFQEGVRDGKYIIEEYLENNDDQ
ncbi:patatin-like phospholipase family protein [Candidatus Dependentiae bacterium]|nr:patatin-like phospholipase family protein [Candidatus Dependentiae bacterium]